MAKILILLGMTVFVLSLILGQAQSSNPQDDTEGEQVQWNSNMNKNENEHIMQKRSWWPRMPPTFPLPGRRPNPFPQFPKPLPYPMPYPIYRKRRSLPTFNENQDDDYLIKDHQISQTEESIPLENLPDDVLYYFDGDNSIINENDNQPTFDLNTLTANDQDDENNSN